MPKTLAKPNSSSSLLEKLNGNYEIRPFPRVVQQLSAALKNSEVKVDEVARIIEADAALASRILRMANSPVFSISREVQTVEHAAVVLGLSRLKNLSNTLAAAAMFSGQNESAEYRRQLWDHSLACATMGRLIAKQTPAVKPDDAFLAGVFHDVGQLFFLDVCFEEYMQLKSGSFGTELVELERQQFGMSHQEVGVKLATAWQLPESIMVVAGFHHEPDNSIAHQDLTYLVHLANSLVHYAGIGSDAVPNTPIQSDVCERLKLNMLELEPLLEKAREEFVEIQNIYQS